MNKQAVKHLERQCRVCHEPAYHALDVHRLTPGSRYHPLLTLVLCASCHRKVHAGLIQIHSQRLYLRTDGVYVVPITDEQGKERYV